MAVGHALVTLQGGVALGSQNRRKRARTTEKKPGRLRGVGQSHPLSHDGGGEGRKQTHSADN